MGLQKRVAFEWWSGEKDNKKVLLLWVDASSLLGCPATKLKDLLIQTIPPNAQVNKIAFRYTVIGPNTSTLLRDMLKEVDSIKNESNVPECPEMLALTSFGGNWSRPHNLLHRRSDCFRLSFADGCPSILGVR